jgi:hypothetical protein
MELDFDDSPRAVVDKGGSTWAASKKWRPVEGWSGGIKRGGPFATGTSRAR